MVEALTRLLIMNKTVPNPPPLPLKDNPYAKPTIWDLFVIAFGYSKNEASTWKRMDHCKEKIIKHVCLLKNNKQQIDVLSKMQVLNSFDPLKINTRALEHIKGRKLKKFDT